MKSFNPDFVQLCVSDNLCKRNQATTEKINVGLVLLKNYETGYKWTFDLVETPKAQNAFPHGSHSSSSTARATTVFFLSNNIQQCALGIHQRVVLLLVGRLRGNRTSRPPKCQPCQSVLRHPPHPLQTFDARTSASVPLTVSQRSPAAPRHRGVTCSTGFTSSKRGQLSGASCPCISAGCCGTTC